MATETNDKQAHYRSINPQPINLLNGKRYGDRYLFDANQTYRIPQSYWEPLKDKPKLQAFWDLMHWYVNDHWTNQLPRILELERYYAGDNNIHYWMSHKKRNRADNRIASGLPRYITNIQVGYQFGTPLTFGYTNENDPDDDGEDLRNAVDDFNKRNDEGYHEKIMGKNLANTGRAYELLYLPKNSNKPRMTPIDPNQCFVVWSTDVDPVELFAVRYYAVNVADKTNYQIEVYTDSSVYYYDAHQDPSTGWKFNHQEPHKFHAVPIIEYALNDERVGKWEPKLDEIDGYDQALSEMANSQEDHSNAMLVISGMLANKNGKAEQSIGPDGQPQFTDAETGKTTSDAKTKSGKVNAPVLVQRQLDTKANALFLKPYEFTQPNGTKGQLPTTASYLTKSLDANEWKIYVDQLLSDVHKDTNTPDTTDQNFAANASGVAMGYKLWGSDQEMSMSDTLYARGVMQRLRLLVSYWAPLSKKESPVTMTDDGDNPANNMTIGFTPNLPKNNQEALTIAQGIASTGKASDQTIREQLATITGVPADQEEQRIQDQQDAADQRTDNEVARNQGLRAIDDDEPDDPDDLEVGDDDDDTDPGTPADKATGASGQAKAQSGR